MLSDASAALCPSGPPAELASSLSANALTILSKRYLMRDAEGQPSEGPLDLFWRVATTLAAVEARYERSPYATPVGQATLAAQFYRLMVQRLWLPNSPTLMNAGRPLGQLAACFVLPVQDELANGTDGIYDTLTSMALIHQSGGGTGFSFSRLRPKGAVVRSTTGVASGPVSFMRLYDASTEVVKQGGTRRGANMGVLRVDHPDILEFIRCKEDGTSILNFNISVAVTTAFMDAVEAGAMYDLRAPHTGAVVGQLDARVVFDAVVHHAWSTGEPGILFLDTANAANPVPHLGQYEATNPCGEQYLFPFDVCNLGSMNLAAFVRSEIPADRPWRDRMDWEAMRQTIHLSTRFLDNVIDVNAYPLPQVKALAQRIRRIGNGVMGYADCLIQLGVPYNSADGVAVGEALAEFFYTECQRASEALADERTPFPEWEPSIWGPDATCARDAAGARIRPERRLRHCNVNTVAPTGTISILAGCSSGIEPLFAVAFMRNQAGALMPEVNEAFVAIARREGWYSETLMAQIARAGHIHFPEVPARWQAVFVTAHDITPAWHIDHQAAWQRWTDSSISKTTNFSQAATEADVREIYLRAYRSGCKGVTVYRDGSRAGQVLSTGATQGAPVAATGASGVPAPVAPTDGALAAALARIEALETDLVLSQAAARLPRRAVRARPDELTGRTRVIESPLGKMYVTLNADEQGEPFEMFLALGKAGGAAMADAEGLARLVSLALRSGIPMEEIHKQLRGISSDKAVGFGPAKVLSVPDAIAQVIEGILREREGVQEELPLLRATGTPAPAGRPSSFSAPANVDQHLAVCSQCRSPGSMEFAEGCLKCHACGHSECA